MDADERRRRTKRMAEHMAAKLDFGTKPDFERASGAAVCVLCGLEYFDHPYRIDLALTVACDGRLLHL